MKRIILYLCVICIAFGYSCSFTNAEAKASTKTIEINYYPQFKFFGDYDIRVFLDNKQIGIMKAGEVLEKEFDLTSGVHKLRFEKKKKKKIKVVKKFKVTDDQRYYNFEVYTPGRKEFKAYRTKTDLEILTMENHPKVLDSINVAEDSWRRYGNKKIGIYNPDVNISDDPLITGNYIASVEASYHRWIFDIDIYVWEIDGMEDVIKDADSAVEFIRNYVNLEKLKRYYNSGESYEVFNEGKEGDEDWRRYVIHYYVNDNGKAEEYPENLYVEIEKNSKEGPVNSLRVWWRGKPGSSKGSNYMTYKEWERRL